MYVYVYECICMCICTFTAWRGRIGSRSSEAHARAPRETFSSAVRAPIQRRRSATSAPTVTRETRRAPWATWPTWSTRSRGRCFAERRPGTRAAHRSAASALRHLSIPRKQASGRTRSPSRRSLPMRAEAFATTVEGSLAASASALPAPASATRRSSRTP